MKHFQFLSLLLPLFVEGATKSAFLKKRQWAELGELLADPLQQADNKRINSLKINVTKIEELKPTLNISGVKRKRFIFGPYKAYGLNSTEKKGAIFRFPPNFAAWQNLKPGEFFSMDPDGTGYQYYTSDDFISDVTVLKVETGLLTKDFKRAETKDGIYNHHNLWFDMAKSSPLPFSCDFWPAWMPDRVVGMTIFSTGGAERISVSYSNLNEGPDDVKTGYYLKKKPMLNLIDVVNYAKEDQQIYQEIDMEYLDGKPQGRLDVMEVTFDPLMCNQGKDGYITGMDIRPNGRKKWTVNADGVTIKTNGYLTGMRGHLHDGGVNIIMRVNGKEICNSKAIYGGPGHTRIGPDGEVWETINEMTHCRNVTKVRKGDKISTEANYDLEKHPSRLVPGSSGGRSHGGHQPGAGKIMTGMKTMLDGGESEQMGLFLVYFAEEPP